MLYFTVMFNKVASHKLVLLSDARDRHLPPDNMKSRNPKIVLFFDPVKL